MNDLTINHLAHTRMNELLADFHEQRLAAQARAHHDQHTGRHPDLHKRRWYHISRLRTRVS